MHADYLLILGGPIKDEKPSDLLMKRIETGAEYLKEHPDMKAVVSGGIKGKTQTKSEARIMADALNELGISDDRIILEEQAKTTLQNFKYTKEMLGEYNYGVVAVPHESKGEQIVLVTNNKHYLSNIRVPLISSFFYKHHLPLFHCQ